VTHGAQVKGAISYVPAPCSLRALSTHELTAWSIGFRAGLASDVTPPFPPGSDRRAYVSGLAEGCAARGQRVARLRHIILEGGAPGRSPGEPVTGRGAGGARRGGHPFADNILVMVVSYSGKYRPMTGSLNERRMLVLLSRSSRNSKDFSINSSGVTPLPVSFS
jgi:hypothetical protein